MKTNQKSVRLSDRAVKIIDEYRGENFSERVENMAYDLSQKREDMLRDYERLQLLINDKLQEQRRLYQQFEKLRMLYPQVERLTEAFAQLYQVDF